MYSPESSVRKTGSYIYEEFMPTDGTDVKVQFHLLFSLIVAPVTHTDEFIVQLVKRRHSSSRYFLNIVSVCLCFWTSQVYTVGPDYAHAEARKSPALDGKVERDSEGKEIRYPVMLTAMEKLVARKVCLAFKVNSSHRVADTVQRSVLEIKEKSQETNFIYFTFT